MAEPVVENIAAALLTRVELVTEGNGYQQTLSALRPKGALGDVTPTNLRAVLMQGDPFDAEESSVEGNGYAQGWWQPFLVLVYLRPSDTDPTPMDTRINRVHADLVKAITSPTNWHTFGGLAIQSKISPPERFEHNDGAHDGVAVVVLVNYRTSETDPYTAR